MLDRERGGMPAQDHNAGAGWAETCLPPAQDVLRALRDGTREVHARLEAAPAMAGLLAPDVTHTQYVLALRGFHAFHAGMRRALAPHARRFLPFDLAAGPALDALAADLAWYGEAVPARAATMPALPDVAAALGALYVLEGSALGGRVIGRALALSLGVCPGFGGSFFGGVTAEAARCRWRDVTALLTRAGSWLDHDGVARAVSAARAGFLCFERLAVAVPAARGQAGVTRPALSGLAAPAIS